ncbi:hypothetical protein CBS101457_003589 [Exobasidium rhododendri]|nr:hypothetical protein CBS101457_003589 [Exobasidium rhododendri]
MAASPKSRSYDYDPSQSASSHNQNAVGGSHSLDVTSSRLPVSRQDTSSSSSLRHLSSGHQHHSHYVNAPITKLKRVDTNDLKSKLATALGNNGKRYWSALLAFMNAKIDRYEFEEETAYCLSSQHVHLHNQLVLGLLYNASAGIPGPSSLRNGSGHHKRDANGDLVGSDGELIGSQEEEEDEDESLNRVLAPPGKRLRMLTAGLSRKDRARIKNIPKNMTHSKGLGSGASSSLGWAGAGADMLEKKRKEEEKRRSIEEKKRVKEVQTQIGAKDWKDQILLGSEQVASVHGKLSLTTQQEIARALAAPLCVESKELPDLESMRDKMTMQAVEAGLPRGAQSQAAALLLAALQNHLQNVTSSIITKVRANRQMGIRTSHRDEAMSSEHQAQLPIVTMDTSNLQVNETEEEVANATIKQSPFARSKQTMRRDLSSLSSSSASLNRASASNSLANSSMVSLNSTAPTSLPESISSDDATTRGRKGEDRGEVGRAQDLVLEGSTRLDDESGTPDRKNDTNLELRHLSFLLKVAPHTVVEPLGLGTQERLLAPDWTAVDENAIREQEWTDDGMLLRESRIAATAKMSSIASSTPSHRSKYIIDQLAPVRLFDRRTLMENQAAHNHNGRSTKGGLTLPASSGGHSGSSNSNNSNNVTTADSAAAVASTSATAGVSVDVEEDGVNENQSTISSASTNFPSRYSNNAPHHHRGLDPHLYDVVDPVALLGSMAN